MFKWLEHRIKWLINQYLYIRYAAPKNLPLPIVNSSSKILFIRLNRIGDGLITTPLISAVKTALNPTIHLLMDTGSEKAFLNNPHIDKKFKFQKKNSENTESQGSSEHIISLLAQENYDVVIDTHDDVSSTVNYFITQLKPRFSFALKKENHLLFTHTVGRAESSSTHVLARVFALTALFGIKTSPPPICFEGHLSKKEQVKNQIDALLGISGTKPLIGINISAGSEARFWGIEPYSLLINLLRNYDCRIIIIYDRRDVNHAQSIHDKTQVAISSWDDYSQFAAAISLTDFLVTPDTQAIHLASAFSVPTFGLYVKYKTNDMIWYPYATEFDCVITKEESLKNITFEEVKVKLLQLFHKVIYERKLHI